MCADICGHVHMRMYILVFSMCLMYDKDFFFFLYPHLIINRIPGEKVSRRRSLEYF